VAFRVGKKLQWDAKSLKATTAPRPINTSSIITARDGRSKLRSQLLTSRETTSEGLLKEQGSDLAEILAPDRVCVAAFSDSEDAIDMMIVEDFHQALGANDGAVLLAATDP